MESIFKRYNLDAVLITDLKNLRYFTGFGGDSGVALITRRNKYLITIPRHCSRAAAESSERGYDVIKSPRKFLEKVHEILIEEGIKNLGIEDQSVSHREFLEYRRRFRETELVGVEDSILRMRSIKTPEEITLIRRAVEITDLAFERACREIRPGMTELEAAGLIEYHFKKLGAEETAFRSIVASGKRSALPHSYASEEVIGEEGFLLMDIGAVYRGYASDMTRTLYLGSSPTHKHLEIYNIVSEAVKRAVQAVKPGVSARVVDGAARDYITQMGYGSCFDHGLGHGVGIEVHEYPRISPGGEDTLMEGMVITIEPGIYIEGFGGVRIEDCVLVTQYGCEVLTSTSREFTAITPKGMNLSSAD